METYVRSAVGLRSVGSESASDFVRVEHDRDVEIVALADGYECGFSVFWPPASRLVLDCFFEAWRTSSGPLQHRLYTAFTQACSSFVAAAPGLLTADADFPDDEPSAILLVAAVHEAQVHVAWIGSGTAIVVRGFEVVAQTTPHTTREQWKRAHPDTNTEALPNILTRYIGGKAPDRAGPTVATFPIARGDTLLLLSKSSFQGPCLDLSEAAYASASYVSLHALVERLVRVGASDDMPYAAVAALRLDRADVAAEIARLIEAYSPAPGHGEWLGTWARQHGALPVWFDLGGAFAMRTDGTVLSVDWDDPEHSTRVETATETHLAAAIGASRHYRALESLAPVATPAAPSCPQCDLFASGTRGCPVCKYLGFTPPRAPAWAHQPRAGGSSGRK